MRMKKTTLILAALLAGQGMSFATSPVLVEKALVQNQTAVAAKGMLAKRDNKSSQQAMPMAKAPAKVMTSSSPTPEGVANDKVYSWLDENVAGEIHDGLYKSAKGYEMGLFRASYFEVSGIGGEYVLDKEKGEIYIYNPITRYVSYSYIKGSIDAEGNITVECPQLLACGDDDGGWAYYVMNCEMNEERTSFNPVEKDLNVYYKLDENGTLSLCEGSQLGMFEYTEYGYYDNDYNFIPVPDTYYYKWLEFVDLSQSMRVFEGETVSPDKELEVEPWTVVYQGLGSYAEYYTSYTSQQIDACIDGDTFWVKGIDKNVPDCWMKGEVKGNEITFKKSFICYDDYAGYFQFLLTGEMVFDEEKWMYVFEQREEVVMTFDAETREIKGKPGQALIVNAGDETIYYLYRWINPIMKETVVGATSAAPLAPLFGTYYPADDQYDAMLIFYLSAIDVNYNPLDKNSIFYEILIDGEPYEFSEEDLGEVYSDPSDDGLYSEFPWDFDSDNLYYWNSWSLSLPFTGYDTIGVRAFYITEEGDYLYSEPFIYDVNSGTMVGVESVEASHGEIVETIFTGLEGVRVSRPEKGIYVMTVVYADGSRRTTKVARR